MQIVRRVADSTDPYGPSPASDTVHCSQHYRSTYPPLSSQSHLHLRTRRTALQSGYETGAEVERALKIVPLVYAQ